MESSAAEKGAGPLRRELKRFSFSSLLFSSSSPPPPSSCFAFYKTKQTLSPERVRTHVSNGAADRICVSFPVEVTHF